MNKLGVRGLERYLSKIKEFLDFSEKYPVA
jgi:hypothetical protein